MKVAISSKHVALPTRPTRQSPIACVAAGILVMAPIGTIANAQQTNASGTIEPDGTVVVTPFRLPPSIYLSEAARKALPKTPTDPEEPMLRALAAGQAGEMRKKMPQFMAPRIKHLAELYPVTMRLTSIANIPAVIATPVRPIPSRNKRKIILNLPGGGFVMGEAGSTGMTESIPLAALARIEVVSITYRQAPESTFPAASEDCSRPIGRKTLLFSAAPRAAC